MIRLLIVEDSLTALKYLESIVTADPALRLIGTAANGEQAVDAVSRQKFDVALMDVHLPGMDGYEAARRIMEAHPLPIVMMSASSSVHDSSTAFRALEAGALTIVAKPQGVGHADSARQTDELLRTVKAMSEVKVIRRWSRPAVHAATTGPAVKSTPPSRVEVVAVGASTGGPPVLKEILSRLPKDFPVPVMVVQHIAGGFIDGFAAWTQTYCALEIRVPLGGEPALPGRIYLAPDDRHMGVDRQRRIVLRNAAAENGHCPSVSFLFRSVAEAFGSAAVGILLTGMGRDGARELKLLKDTGAITIAQDEASSVVFGMPGEAVRLHAATAVLSPIQIAEYVVANVRAVSRVDAPVTRNI